MYNDIISPENLLEAWKEFLKGKRGKRDVQEFQYKLSDNICSIHAELKNKSYIHGGYHAFNISDPKPRNIHKATVRDRIVHHALYRKLYPLFEALFIHDSYSCRKWRGTHRALKRFREFADRASKNDTETLWILKCDVRKFFASIDQKILISILQKYIPDHEVINLIQTVTDSFHSTAPGKGLPLGNLTSQLLVNVYMNEFDRFAKRELKAKYYLRYADDFVIMSRDRAWLTEILPNIRSFLNERLALKLHPNKISIATLASGIDFLGWVHFPDHLVLRTSTKKRMFRRLNETCQNPEIRQSYLGLLSHGNTEKIKSKIEYAGLII
jgi:retron-type reverse transcriptase